MTLPCINTCNNQGGEQPLPEHSNCLLGSVNLVKYVINPFSAAVSFDFDRFKSDVYTFNRMLDDVIEISNLPLKEQQLELFRKRRHGIGFLGAGSMFNIMMMRYGGTESVKLISKISQILAETSVRAGIDLAILKGPAPIMNEEFVITKKLLNKFPKLASHFTIGEMVFGKELIVYSDYMQRMPLELREEVLRYGMRFSHATSIAPTGTMALGIENNVSNGIEPTYEHVTLRNVIKTGKKAKESMTVYSYEMLLYKHMFGEHAKIPDYFVSSSDITPMEHINIQAAVQPYIDSAISKCIAKGTRIITNKGFLKIETFSNNVEPNVFEDVEMDVSALCSDGKYYKISSHYCNGIQPTKRITFDNGIVKEVSHTHKFINGSNFKWVSAENLKVGNTVLYKAAVPIEFNEFHKEHYGFIHGILRNKNVLINKEQISTELSFINLDLFCSIINSIKDLKLVCVNNVIKLNDQSYNFISKLRHEFSFNKLFKSPISEREDYLNNIRSRIFVVEDRSLFNERFDLKEEAQNISELLYSIGKDSAIIKTTVVELSKKYITTEFISTAIVKIEDRECEVFDVSVEDKHEYLIHGIVSHNTINCPTEISYDDFKQIYLDAYDNGLKGCALFRFNPENHQGVLVKEDNLKATKYKITTNDGNEIILSGNEIVNYENEDSTVANLYDALKEGYYNKF